jgi:hypothetical protein
MTASKPSGEQLADADPQLLTAALNHTWACYDTQISRAFQIVSFYLVIAAIAGTAYTNAITNKEYGVGVALAIFGLVLTAITAVAGLREVNAASYVQPVLAGLQAEVARRVGIESIRGGGSEPMLQRRLLSATIAVGLGALFNIGALLFAVSH